MYTFERLYVAKVFYDASTDTIDKVEVFAHGLMSVEVETDCGGSCWGPCVTLQGDSEYKVREAADKLVRYIKRFKDHKFY